MMQVPFEDDGLETPIVKITAGWDGSPHGSFKETRIALNANFPDKMLDDAVEAIIADLTEYQRKQKEFEEGRE